MFTSHRASCRFRVLLAALIPVLLCVSLPVLGDDLDWVFMLPMVATEGATSVATDESGNYYATGYYQGTVDFDPGPGSYPLQPEGESDIYVLKLNSDGSFGWATSWGANATERGYDLVRGATGKFFVAGVGSLTAGIVWQLGPNGESGWRKWIPMESLLRAVVVDDADNVYAGGLVSGSGESLIKLDTTQPLAWTVPVAGTVEALELDPAGEHIYAAGTYNSPDWVDFDPGPGVFLLPPSSVGNGWIAKFDTNGVFLWARALDSPSWIEVRDTSIDPAGNVYLTGRFHTTLGTYPPVEGFGLVQEGWMSAFVLSLDPQGVPNWVVAWDSDEWVRGDSIDVDATGQVFVTGLFKGTADFDPGERSLPIESQDHYAGFVSRFSTDGDFRRVIALKGTDDVRPASVKSTGDGHYNLVGRFWGSADFDPGGDIYQLTATGHALWGDPFFARYAVSNDGPVAQCQTVSAEAGPGCVSAASIDAGSYDPDEGQGGSLTLQQSPPSPYGLGVTPVTLTAIDAEGATAFCTADVVDTTFVGSFRAPDHVVAAQSPDGRDRGRADLGGLLLNAPGSAPRGDQ